MRGLLSIVVVASALTFVGASRASVGQSSYQPATLTIATVPTLAGVHLGFDGRTYVTGRQGKVRIETTRGQHWLQILDTRLNTPRVRSTFSRWEDNRYTAGRTITIRGNTVVDAGFQQSVRVSFAFADLAGRSVVGRVSRMTLKNTLGSRSSFAPSWPQWLRATGLARSYRGLEPTFVQYSVERALVNGSNVVNQSQQRFYPAKTRRFTAQLLLYSARVRVRDFLFGTSIGNQLSLVYPSGTSVGYRLRGGNLLLSSLPRGTYTLDVHAGGYVPSVSLALSKNQSLDVKVVSYLDMALLLVLVLLSVTVLILFPRPFLRLRLRALGSGRRPTPDDLEPLTPLSRARKKLIDRYMPAPETGGGRPAGSSASRAVPRLPLPTPRPTVVPASGESVDRPLRKLPSRSFETAAGSLRRGRQRLSDVPGLPLPLRPAARGQVPEEAALSGERIDLINVYMQEQTTSTQEIEVPAAQQPQQPKAVPNAAVAAHSDALRTTAEPESPAPPAPPMLAPVINPSPAPAVEEKPASAVEEAAVAPAVEEKPASAVEEAVVAPAVEEKPAPAVEEAVVAPAVEEKPAPAVEEAVAPAVEEKPAPAVEEAAAAPVVEEKPAPAVEEAEAAAPAVAEKPAPAVEEAVAPAIEEKPAPAVEDAVAPAIKEKPKPTSPQKRPAPARRKHAARVAEEKLVPSAEGDGAPAIEEQPAPPRERTAPAVEEKPAQAVEGGAGPSRKRAAPAGRKRPAATGEASARPATRKRAAPAKQKRAPAAKAKTTAQPVRKRAAAKEKSTTAANGKNTTAQRRKSQAPTKPKPKPRTAKKAATPAATQPRTRRTSVSPAPRDEAAGDHDAGAATNGEASRAELARVLPDFVAAVEALREDLIRISTANQGGRANSGTLPR